MGYKDFANYYRRYRHDLTSIKPCKYGAEKAQGYIVAYTVIPNRRPLLDLVGPGKYLDFKEYVER